MHKEATKLSAVWAVAGALNISLADVIAFGDDSNDKDMLRGCGMGVAVGNALDEVKEAADFICGTNDNDGVARWLAGRVL